jgi:subtilisin family serine protease
MAENHKQHLLLKNQIQTIEKFPKRGMVPSKKKNEEEEDEIINKDYEPKKRTLRNDLQRFNNLIEERHQKRTIEIPAHIDYVKIYTHGVFNFDLQTKFRRIYGLSPVKYEYFNKVVLCAIVDEDAFETFKSHIIFFAEQNQDFNPIGTDYYLLVHVDRFELLSSNRIIRSIVNEETLLEIIDNQELVKETDRISKSLSKLFELEKESNTNFKYEIRLEYSLISLKNFAADLIDKIVDNFDIIYKVQGHTYKTGPDRYGLQLRSVGFDISPDEKTTLVGIIDTGIQQNSVLRNIIENYQYDIANSENPLPIFDNDGHGSSIAMLAALGTDFYDTNITRFVSLVKVVPIKVMENVIRDAAGKNIRLFNLSINESSCKFYNEGVSEQAFLLDKLANELDILFFISVGNLNLNDMANMRDNPNPLHNYPNHFFNPFIFSDEHCCEGTNIHSPAESYNNISIGAIAENLNANDSDLTYSKDLPAYYTKKYHLNYSEKINGFHPTKSVINNNLFKPDLVAPGGDAIASNAGMEVLSLRPGILTESSYGTSNAAPLITNLAAQIKNTYPNIKTQTIKALLINSAGLTYNSNFLSDLIVRIKRDYITNVLEKTQEELSQSEKMLLSRLFNKERLLNYLVGHGLPNQIKTLFSNDNSATLVIEETVNVDSHKGLIIKIPKYLNGLADQEKKTVASITATLCYSFDPIMSNFLAYNPIHISFAFFKPLNDDLSKSIDILAGYTSKQKQDHPELKELVEWAKKEKEFKSGIRWSEDYSPIDSMQFSNTQKITIPFRICDLVSTNNELNLVIRCATKKNIDPLKLLRIQEKEHPFSLVIRIEEKEIDGNLTGKLYSELQLINTLEAIAEAELEAEV